MTEAAAAEVHADPNEAFLVAHEVDVVIAGPDRAELAASLLLVGGHVRRIPRLIVIEQVVLNALVVHATDAERDHLGDLPRQVGNVALDLAKGNVETNRHVAKADVESDAGNAYLLLIRNDAADRLGITEVTVGADHAGDDVATFMQLRIW